MEEYLRRLPQELQDVISLAQKIAGRMHYRAYLVGGFVRDLILKVPNLDMDIVVEGNGVRFAEELALELKGKLTRHHRFGTATVVLPDKRKIDISTARKETYPHPGALPVVSTGSIQDDLKRRDFTINAMAINISPDEFGQFVDFFGGKEDLAHRRIRIMHDISFIDDPTRILRAVRFEQRYNLTPESGTRQLLHEAAQKNALKTVDKQRIRDEIILLLKEKEPIKCILRLHKLLGLSFISSGMRLTQQKIRLLRAVEKEIMWFNREFWRSRQLESWVVYFMALSYGVSQRERVASCKKFAFRVGETKRIVHCEQDRKKIEKQLSAPSIAPSVVYRLLEPMSYETIILAKAAARKKSVQNNIEEFLHVYNGTRVHVTGDDLKALGVKPGPYFKKILTRLLYAKLDLKLKTKEQELAFVKKLMKM